MEHKGFTLWFTGLPCSGKTVLADVLADELKKKRMKVERLDGDVVRKSLTRDLGFTEDKSPNDKVYYDEYGFKYRKSLKVI